MPNLILTNQCFNDCSFCFVDRKNDGQFLSCEQVQSLMPFIRSFNRDTVHLLGGEPTLNPDFSQILELLLNDEFKVKVFTNGKLALNLVEHLQCLHEGEFYFCVNRTQPSLIPKIVQFYNKLGFRTQLSVTIFQTDQIIEHIFNEILTYKLDHHYRLGISLPIWPELQNQYLVPSDYKLVSEHLFTFIQKGVQSGIRPMFDCGFPYCFFNEEQRAYFSVNEIHFKSNCGPIPDVGPGLFAMPCFPLALLSRPILCTSDWSVLNGEFENTLGTMSYKPIFEKCDSCEALQNKTCSGGCAALRMVDSNLAK